MRPPPRRVTVYTYWEQTEPPWDYDVPWIVRMFVRWAITIVGFLAAEWFVNDVWYDSDKWVMDGAEALILSTLIFVFIRALVRPFLILLSCACLVLTLGLFITVVNALIVILTEEICDWLGIGFSVDGFWPAFIGALVVSFVSFLISRLLRRNPFQEPA
jgi:putative membrane protein